MPSLCLTNARSVNNKFDELSLFAKQFNPDFLCVTETWLTDSISDNTLWLSGYNLFRSDRPSGNRGGGLCVWVNNVFSVDAVLGDSSNNDVEILILQTYISYFACIGIDFYKVSFTHIFEKRIPFF